MITCCLILRIDTRYETGKQYPIYCRKKSSETAPEEIMVDASEVAKDHAYCVVTGIDVSLNNQYLIYAVDTTGRYQYHLQIKDLQSKKILPENLPAGFGGSA